MLPCCLGTAMETWHQEHQERSMEDRSNINSICALQCEGHFAESFQTALAVSPSAALEGKNYPLCLKSATRETDAATEPCHITRASVRDATFALPSSVRIACVI